MLKEYENVIPWLRPVQLWVPFVLHGQHLSLLLFPQGMLYPTYASLFLPHLPLIEPLLLAGLLAILMPSLKPCLRVDIGRWTIFFHSFTRSQSNSRYGHYSHLWATLSRDTLLDICLWPWLPCPGLLPDMAWTSLSFLHLGQITPPKSAVPRGHSWPLLLLPQPFSCNWGKNSSAPVLLMLGSSCEMTLPPNALEK